MTKFFRIIVCALAMAVTGTAVARAAVPATTSFYEKAVRSQQAGHYESAVLQYTQSLLFDSYSRDSAVKIRRILQEDKTILPGMRPLWSRFLELADFIEFLQTRITQVAADNAETLAFLRTSKASAKEMREAELLTEQTSSTEESPARRLFIQSFPESLEGSPQLAQVIDLLDKRKSELLARLQTGLRAEKKLWKVRNRLVSTMIAAKIAPAPAVLPEGTGNEPYAVLSRQIRSLQVQVDDTKKKTARLIRQVADLSMQVYEKDTQLARKNEETDHLKQKLGEAQQRFYLVQHLLLDKDRTIEALQAVQKQEPHSPAPAGVTTKDMMTLSADFSSLKERSSASPQTTRLVQALGTQVRDLQVKFLVMDQHLKDRDKQLTKLQGELAKQKKELANRPPNGAGQEGQIAQLNGIIEIYKAKLGETRRRLQETQLELYMRSLKDDNAREASNKKRTVAFGQPRLQDASSFDLDGFATWTDAGIFQRIKAHLRDEAADAFSKTSETGTEPPALSPGALLPNAQDTGHQSTEKANKWRSKT